MKRAELFVYKHIYYDDTEISEEKTHLSYCDYCTVNYSTEYFVQHHKNSTSKCRAV